MLKFNKIYFAATLILFFIEVLIALCIHDKFIRPFVGDVLVVLLMYCFLKSFTTTPSIVAALIVLFVSFFIEFLQYIKIVKILHLEPYSVLKTVLGTSFSSLDLLCYFIGYLIIIGVEFLFSSIKHNPKHNDNLKVK